jgi:hypothetical protein
VFGIGPEGNAFTNLTGRKSDKLSAQLGTFVDTLSGKRAQNMLRLGINPTALPPEDEDEINVAFGIGGTNTSTPQEGGFNPATYYKQ